jgi:hypothetical protein
VFKQTPTPTTTEQSVEDAAAPTATPAQRVPIYRLRKRLDEMELALRYPKLSRRWRRRMPAFPDPRNQPGEDGTIRSAARGKPKAKPQ